MVLESNLQTKVSNQPAIDDKAKTNSQIESQTGL
jgi:hypothetical protein